MNRKYNASKAGVVQLAKCLSVEWVDYCRVNCISPGFIATDILVIHPKEWREKWLDMIPAKRMAECYELKGVRSRLLQDRADLTIPSRLMFSVHRMRLAI